MSSRAGSQNSRQDATSQHSAVGFDGTSESPRGSHRGSQPGSRTGSVTGGSPSRSSTTRPNPFPPSLGFDPGRDPDKRELTEAQIIGKNVDLPPEAYYTVGTSTYLASYTMEKVHYSIVMSASVVGIVMVVKLVLTVLRERK